MRRSCVWTEGDGADADANAAVVVGLVEEELGSGALVFGSREDSSPAASIGLEGPTMELASADWNSFPLLRDCFILCRFGEIK